MVLSKAQGHFYFASSLASIYSEPYM